MTRYFKNQNTVVQADNYTLEISKDFVSVILDNVAVTALDIRTGVCTPDTVDNEGEILTLECESFAEDRAVFTWTSESNLWKKTYTVTCFDSHFEYEVCVEGEGDVDSVNYFGGKMTDKCHGSEYDFQEGYYPLIPLDGSVPYEYAPIKDNATFSYLSVPPMFVRIFRTVDVKDKLAFGLVAQMGEHNFTEFNYRTSMDRWGSKFWLSTDQSGHTHVSGKWTAPKIIGYASPDNDSALKKYCDYYFDSGICGRGDDGEKPRFWYGPIACGWLEQLAHSYAGGYGLTDASRQFLYEEFVEKLKARNLHPKILIIDDRWQIKYGTAEVNPDKWQDLRGFIDRVREEEGIHTFMWYKMWDGEGVPEEYCVWDEKENRWIADPTNPGYRAILKETLHRIISSDEGCYNADGLKLDFAFWQPIGKKFKTYTGKYGVELFYELVKFIRETVKEIKPYAVINGSPCHPIFADLIDQSRLHDYDYRLRDAFGEFSTRANLFRIALPNALVDTDGCGYNTKRDTMRYLVNCRKIGIPDMYNVSDTPYLKFTEEDWKEVAEAWREYENELEE